MVGSGYLGHIMCTIVLADHLMVTLIIFLKNKWMDGWIFVKAICTDFAVHNSIQYS